MKKIFGILFFCLFLGGCYSQGTISEDRSIINSNSGPKFFLNFIVVQDLQDIHTLLWAPKARVDIDGKKIAKLKKNQTTQISVTPNISSFHHFVQVRCRLRHFFGGVPAVYVMHGGLWPICLMESFVPLPRRHRSCFGRAILVHCRFFMFDYGIFIDPSY